MKTRCSRSIPDDEFSQQLSPLLPKTKHTGSIVDTMLATAAVQERGDNPQEWTLDSLGSRIVLPKVSSRCVLDSRQQDCLINLYSYIYSLSVTEIDIAHTCSSYLSVTIGGKFFVTNKSRSAASSVIIAQWDSNLLKRPSTVTHTSELRAARIKKCFKYTVTIKDEVKVHMLAPLSFYKAHPQSQSFGKPICDRPRENHA